MLSSVLTVHRRCLGVFGHFFRCDVAAALSSVSRYMWKNGKWDAGELVQSPYIQLHINSNVLHYGQALFEGLKVFHGKDGKVGAALCAGAGIVGGAPGRLARGSA